jgi:phosphoglycerate dehydrogenase-like enzyme
MTDPHEPAAPSRLPGQHRDPLRARRSEGDPRLAAEPVVESGPIAVLPEPSPSIANAVSRAGGVIAPLDAATRGLIWLGGAGSAIEETLAAHPQIEWVQLPLAGVDTQAAVLAAHAGRARPIWTSAKGAYAEPVAEHALTLALSMLRQIPDKARATSWQVPRQALSLFGRRVTIVGAGGIADELIRLLAPFETPVTVVRRSGGNVPGATRTVLVERLDEVLPETDVLVLAAAATEETRGLIGAERLAALPSDAVLVNIARGVLLDTDALLATLDAGHLWGAALDVTDPEPLPDGHPLWNHERCVVTSHTADTDEMVELLLAERVEHNVAAFLGRGTFIGVVDPGKGY